MTLTLRADVSATDTDDGMVLLDEANGRYWQLNTTAALILRALLGGATPQQTAHRLGERYPQLAAERRDQDVTALVRSLLDARLVVRA